MLPRPHVTSGRLAKRKKNMCWSAVSQPTPTRLQAKPVAISYSQPNDSMVLDHSC